MHKKMFLVKWGPQNPFDGTGPAEDCECDTPLSHPRARVVNGEKAAKAQRSLTTENHDVSCVA